VVGLTGARQAEDSYIILVKPGVIIDGKAEMEIILSKGEIIPTL
jgi:hypothetical protein